MEYQDINFELEDGVAVVRLNRPDALNTFSGKMGIELGHAYRHCDEDDERARLIQQQAAGNIKRVISRLGTKWNTGAAQDPYFIKDTQETKTTWHPIGD